MKNVPNIKLILLSVYFVLVVGIFLSIIYPTLLKPKGLSQTKIPSLSVTDLNEANRLFSASGKVREVHPTEPDINNYIYGQRDPITIQIERPQIQGVSTSEGGE
jgi:hypothetical protein